jgi:hypothetical protein
MKTDRPLLDFVCALALAVGAANVTAIAADNGSDGKQAPTAERTPGCVAASKVGSQVSAPEHCKTAIAPIGSNSARLQLLRPVTFQYKADPGGTWRYGLIAEEVARVYPELVTRDPKGRIDGVRYDELAPLLLNEVQEQQKLASAQAAQLRDVQRQLALMQAAFARLQAKDEFIAAQ